MYARVRVGQILECLHLKLCSSPVHLAVLATFVVMKGILCDCLSCEVRRLNTQVLFFPVPLLIPFRFLLFIPSRLGRVRLSEISPPSTSTSQHHTTTPLHDHHPSPSSSSHTRRSLLTTAPSARVAKRCSERNRTCRVTSEDRREAHRKIRKIGKIGPNRGRDLGIGEGRRERAETSKSDKTDQYY